MFCIVPIFNNSFRYGGTSISLYDLQGEYLDCHTPICLKLPGAEVGGTVRCPMYKLAAEVYFYYVKNSVKN